MNTGKEEKVDLLFEDLTYKIIGAAMDIKYKNAVFKRRLRADLLVEEKVLVEKQSDHNTHWQRGSTAVQLFKDDGIARRIALHLLKFPTTKSKTNSVVHRCQSLPACCRRLAGGGVPSPARPNAARRAGERGQIAE